MALQGNLRDFSATEILQLLGSQKKTGCLFLEWNTERAAVYVVEGRIVSTRMPGAAKDDSLLGFLTRIHRLSDEQQRGILSIQRESNRDLEDLLINGRYLDAEELASYVERQILEELTRIVRWESGNYRFDPNARWANSMLVKLSIEGSLIEAARRVDEQKRYVTIFRDPHQLLGVRELPDPNDPMSEPERELFGLIDGQHTVDDIVRSSAMTEYETFESLHRMLEASWIEIVGRRDPGAVPLPPAPVGPQMRRPEERPVWRELVMAVACVALLLGLRWLSWAAERSATAPPAGDVFAVANERDLRFGLELYRREKGSYPKHVEDLVEERWIPASRATFPGYTLDYHADPTGASYTLELKPAR